MRDEDMAHFPATWRGDPELTIRQAEQALELDRTTQNSGKEVEDLRVLANALTVSGQITRAEGLLLQVIDRSRDNHELAATARRDLAHLLAREGRSVGARRMAAMARDSFQRLGAKLEVDKLDALLEELGV